MDDLLENHLPEIARKMNCSIEAINRAIERMSKLDTSPGLQIGPDQNHPITPDVIVEPDEESGGYSVRLADTDLPHLRVSDYYAGMVKDTQVSETTRKFLQGNLRSAQWIIDAIEQRKNTLLKVAAGRGEVSEGLLRQGAVASSPVADVESRRGGRGASGHGFAGRRRKVHSLSLGVLPLRKFFSGGREDTDGLGHSWEGIRAKLQEIIDGEDKAKPLSDDQIRKMFRERRALTTWPAERSPSTASS